MKVNIPINADILDMMSELKTFSGKGGLAGDALDVVMFSSKKGENTLDTKAVLSGGSMVYIGHAEAAADDEYTVFLPIGLLATAAEKMGEGSHIEYDTEQNFVTVVKGKGRMKVALAGGALKDIITPMVSRVKGFKKEPDFTLKLKEMAAGFASILYAGNPQGSEGKPIYCRGINMKVKNGAVDMFATDGVAVGRAKFKTDSDSNIGIIVPYCLVNFIQYKAKRLGKTKEDVVINVFMAEQYMAIKIGDTTVITGALNGEPLDVDKILAQAGERFTVELKTADLDDCIDKALVFVPATASKGYRGAMRVTVSSDELLVGYNSPIGSIDEAVQCEVLDASDLSNAVVGFDPRRIGKTVGALSSNDELVIEFAKDGMSTKPALFRPANSSVDEGMATSHILLPVRIA